MVEEIAQVLVEVFGGEDADVVEVVEAVEQAREEGEVVERAARLEALEEQVFVQVAAEERKSEKLVEEAGEVVVGIVGERPMFASAGARPAEQIGILGAAECGSEKAIALLVVVTPDVQMSVGFPLPHLGKLGEEEDQRADQQADFFAIEELIGARRVDGDVVRFQVGGQRRHPVVLDRAEQERDLVPVLQLAPVAECVEEGEDFFVPVRFGGAQEADDAGDGREFFVWGRRDGLGVTEGLAVVRPFLIGHPAVVEGDHVAV